MLILNVAGDHVEMMLNCQLSFSVLCCLFSNVYCIWNYMLLSWPGLPCKRYSGKIKVKRKSTSKSHIPGYQGIYNAEALGIKARNSLTKKDQHTLLSIAS